MPRQVPVLRPERSSDYESDELTITLDAAAITKALTAAVAKHHREAIASGQLPSGGSQRALGPDERARAGQGKRSPRRGMGQEGRFVKSIGSQSSRGDLKATGAVAADPYFDDWQERERSRGVEYFEADGDVEDVVDAVLEAELKRMGFR